MTSPMTRARFVEQLSNAVHAVQSAAACCSNCDNHVLNKSHKDVRELCRILNALFAFGLSAAYDSYWPLVREIISRHQAREILNTWKPKSSRGKALAWLYQSLNEGALEWQIYSLLNNYSILTRYYSKNAFVLDKQILEMTGMFLRGLEGVRIYLQPKNGAKREETANGCVAVGEVPARSGPKGEAASSDGVVVVSRSAAGLVRARISSKLLLEQSVADLSDCPEVLGLSAADSDLLLLGTEVSVDAMEFDFPEEVFRPWAAPPVRPAPKRRLPTGGEGGAVPIGRSVPKIDDGEAGCSTSLETSNTYACVPAPPDFDSTEAPGTTPLTQTDADKMLREILRGRRRPTPEGSETPVENCKAPSAAADLETSSDLATSPLYKTGASRNSSLFRNADDDFLSFNEENREQPTIQPKISTPLGKQLGNEAAEFDDEPRREKPPSAAEEGGRVFSEFERQVLSRFEKVFRPDSPVDDFSENSSLIFNAELGLPKEDRERPTPDASEAEFFTESGDGVRAPPSQDGQIALESGEIYELTANVMHDGEQFYKMFGVFLNHRLGTPLARRLLLSTKCLYLLIAEKAKAGEEGGRGPAYYVVDFRVPFDRIDYVSVGLNGQFFTLHLKQKRRSIVICTASDAFTRSVLSNLDVAARRLSPGAHPPNVYTESRPQTVCLKKWILGETGLDENRICYYGLIYWNPNLAKSRFGALSTAGPNRNGYLYVREFYPNGWFRKSTEWRQSYFILQGKKFYQFEDLSCKVGQRVFNLQDEIVGCRQTETVEHTYCLELCSKDPSLVIQLACPTKHELQQWLCAFFNSFSQAELPASSSCCSACCVVLTDNYALLGQETSSIGFVRTLAFARLEALCDFKTCRKYDSLLVTVTSTNRENDEQWLLSFISEAELDNFMAALKPLVSSLACEELAPEPDQEGLIEESRLHWFGGLRD